MQVYVSIGNSDDKLTQEEWACFWAEVNRVIGTWAERIHGVWLSPPHDRWQNACWAFEIAEEEAVRARAYLRDLAARYRQESIAWAVAETTFLGAAA